MIFLQYCAGGSVSSLLRKYGRFTEVWLSPRSALLLLGTIKANKRRGFLPCGDVSTLLMATKKRKRGDLKGFIWSERGGGGVWPCRCSRR